MSKKKKRRNNNFKKKTVEVATPLASEVINITKKIQETDKHLYELESKKRVITENMVDLILLNNDLKNLINDYCNISEEIKEDTISQNNRKKDLEFKKTKLNQENMTMVKEVTDFMKIGDMDRPVGLYNTECRYPVAICQQKNVYLSYNDIRYKKCLKHRDGKPCKHLSWINGDATLY